MERARAHVCLREGGRGNCILVSFFRFRPPRVVRVFSLVVFCRSPLGVML